jgi:uncharacterized coiled-coil protein SlyX
MFPSRHTQSHLDHGQRWTAGIDSAQSSRTPQRHLVIRFARPTQSARMSEDREILDFLRANFARFNERFDRVDTRLDELTTRISSLERDVASLSLRIAELKVDFSAMQSRLDIMDRRIDRIERRLELAGPLDAELTFVPSAHVWGRLRRGLRPSVRGPRSPAFPKRRFRLERQLFCDRSDTLDGASGGGWSAGSLGTARVREPGGRPA